jgi:hypothetical protein
MKNSLIHACAIMAMMQARLANACTEYRNAVRREVVYPDPIAQSVGRIAARRGPEYWQSVVDALSGKLRLAVPQFRNALGKFEAENDDFFGDES